MPALQPEASDSKTVFQASDHTGTCSVRLHLFAAAVVLVQRVRATAVVRVGWLAAEAIAGAEVIQSDGGGVAAEEEAVVLVRAVRGLPAVRESLVDAALPELEV